VIVCPARLDPVFSPRPWGSRSLAPLFPEKINLMEPIGEAWMTGQDSRFAGGPFAGKTLGEAWSEMPSEWTGTRFDRPGSEFPAGNFPLLVKFIFAEEKLSVQVHPDDEFASQHEKAAGGRGKTEMWYSLHARPDAEVLVGMKPDVTLEKFQQALAEGNAEDCLQRVCLAAGDAIFVPAGTAHTIGGGNTFCEIQQHSDLTYRVYDYNRRDAQGRARELHTEKALQVIRFGEKHGGKLEPARVAHKTHHESHLVACRYFAVEKWEFRNPLPAASSRDHFDLLIFFEGSGAIKWGSESVPYSPAHVWLIPAALGDYELVPQSPTSLLRTFVPGELSDHAAHLEKRGVQKDAAARLLRW